MKLLLSFGSVTSVNMLSIFKINPKRKHLSFLNTVFIQQCTGFPLKNILGFSVVVMKDLRFGVKPENVAKS